MGRTTPGGRHIPAGRTSSLPKPRPRLSPVSARVWMKLVDELLGSVDPNNDPKDFKMSEDLDLVVENWGGGRSVFLPKGSEIFLPNQIKSNSGKPSRGSGYAMVTVDKGQREIVYVLRGDEKGEVSFESRPQPAKRGGRHVSSYPLTLL